jgi:capsid portal protein
MSRKNKKVRMCSRIDLADALRKESSLSAFTFDGPYRLTGHDLLDNMYCADNGRWYETPVDWYGLARAARQTSWHQSALYFKRNVLLGCYIPHPLLSRQDFSALALDWFVFGNAFLELRSNMLGEPLKLRHALAKYMRRGSDLESWWYVQDGKDAFQFRPGKVCHLMNPDINQEIYGMPEYLGQPVSFGGHVQKTVLRQRIPRRVHHLHRCSAGKPRKHGLPERNATGCTWWRCV